MALSIRAPRRPPLNEMATQRMLLQVGCDLDGIVQQRTRSLAFGNIYNNMYNLVIGQKGEQLYELIVHTIRKMSLVKRPLVFYTAVGIVKDCAMYLDGVWTKRHEQMKIVEVADMMYARPVAQRWRRALAYAKWWVRTRGWRVAFDEVYLAPGNVGALRAEEHFRECSQHEGWGVPLKRVKLDE